MKRLFLFALLLCACYTAAAQQQINVPIAPKNWQDIKTKLSEYIGSSFTQNEFNSFIAPYDYYFTHD